MGAMKPHPTHEVLLVDPDLEMRACRALYLQMRGIRVVGTRAADDTLRQLRAGFRPCVVLTDPGSTGDRAWELVDYLRRDSVLATVPLVLMTHDSVEAMRSERHGVRECIGRHATPQSFVAAIERQCRRRSGRSFLPSEIDIRPRPRGAVRRLRVHDPVLPPLPEPAPPLLRRLA